MKVIIIKTNPEIISEYVKWKIFIPTIKSLAQFTVISDTKVHPYLFSVCNPETEAIFIHALTDKDELINLIEKMKISEQLEVKRKGLNSFLISPIIVFYTDLDLDSIPGVSVFNITDY